MRPPTQYSRCLGLCSFRQKQWGQCFDCGMATPSPHHSLDALSFNCWWALQIASPHYRIFHLMFPPPLNSEILSPHRSMVYSRGSFYLLPYEVACFHSFCWPSGLHSYFPYLIPDHVPIFPSLSLPTLSSLCQLWGHLTVKGN